MPLLKIYVKDGATGAPINHARVTCNGATHYTDANGYRFLGNWPANTDITLNVSASGYNPADSSFRMPGHEYTHEIWLYPAAPPSAPPGEGEGEGAETGPARTINIVDISTDKETYLPSDIITIWVGVEAVGEWRLTAELRNGALHIIQSNEFDFGEGMSTVLEFKRPADMPSGDYHIWITAPYFKYGPGPLIKIRKPAPPPPPPEEEAPPEEAPPAPDIWSGFIEAAKDIYGEIVGATATAMNGLFELITGRPPTEEDVLGITSEAAKWWPMFNVFSKAIYGVDLKTGKPATYEDITTEEMVWSAVDIATAVVGATALEKIGAKLYMKSGALISRQTILKIFQVEGQAVLKGATRIGLRTGLMTMVKGALKAGLASMAKNPIMSVFVITEIPNLIMMMQFARHQVAEEGGITVEQASFRMAKHEKVLQSLMWDLKAAKESGNTERIDLLLERMEKALNAYRLGIERDRTILEEANSYESTKAMFDYFSGVLTSEKELREPIEIPDEITGEVRQVIDGDTIKVLYANRDYVIRLAGINAPELAHSGAIKELGGPESAEWLQKKIWGETVKVRFDPENKTDKYGRLVGVVFLDGENINIESLRNGWSNVFFYEPNALVDEVEYLAALNEAKSNNRGMWNMLRMDVGDVKFTTSPSNAQIFIDGRDTGLRTTETIKGLAAARHTIRLSLEGYEDEEFDIEVEAGKLKEVYIKMRKTKVEKAPARPSRSTLESQFKLKVITEEEARAGLSALGYTDVDIDRFIDEWKAEQEKKELEETTGRIKITSKPTHAYITLDDEFTLLMTPETLKNIEPGVHRVVVSLFGYEPWSTDVPVEKGKITEIHADLKKIGEGS